MTQVLYTTGAVVPSTLNEVYEVDGHEVACDGDGGALGHPRVYLHIDPTSGNVTCPYCSRTYIYASHSHT